MFNKVYSVQLGVHKHTFRVQTNRIGESSVADKIFQNSDYDSKILNGQNMHEKKQSQNARTPSCPLGLKYYVKEDN